MFSIRPFHNSDPPALAAIWNEQPPQRALAQPVSPAMLELCVFSKQAFDPEGLLVAERGGRIAGFVHAGFGPDEIGQSIDTTLGTTHLLMLRPDDNDPELADELIARSEAYQRERGATVHYAGGIRPLDAFYLGLYGGSELPGVLDSDGAQASHFTRNGYVESGHVVVLQRELSRMRLGGPRETRTVRRDTSIEQTISPRLGIGGKRAPPAAKTDSASRFASAQRAPRSPTSSTGTSSPWRPPGGSRPSA